jgi:hypothetical protein
LLIPKTGTLADVFEALKKHNVKLNQWEDYFAYDITDHRIGRLRTATTVLSDISELASLCFQVRFI